MRYATAEIKFLTYNSESKDVEICKSNEKEIVFSKSRVVELLDKEITCAEEKLSEFKRKKEFFLTEFGAYFKNAVEVDVYLD